MVFWRKKSNETNKEQEKREKVLFHRAGEPDLEPVIEDEAKFDTHILDESEGDVLDELDEIPVPEHTYIDDVKEKDELADHSAEAGWFSRLTQGLSRSTTKFTQGLTDIVTKSKLDQETLDQLEELLIAADLGPKTASKVIADFSQGRFGKDISEKEIRAALAESMAKILVSVAKPLDVKKSKPYVVLVCGVNGAGKTTTIGKYTHYLQKTEGKSVMIAAADTFRAAAVEQLAEWARRNNAAFVSKDVGADSAAVAYEAYEEAIAKGVDVLLIDTAGRLQNKSNLMAELEKIIRVLKKKDSSVPHAKLLVLDATTGQNAYSQVETFKKMVDVTGLIVTKLDGSAKGGVLVGLADQFGLPVHAIGVGEGIEDLRPFKAADYARSLMGLGS